MSLHKDEFYLNNAKILTENPQNVKEVFIEPISPKYSLIYVVFEDFIEVHTEENGEPPVYQETYETLEEAEKDTKSW